jgi:hypothetical protein
MAEAVFGSNQTVRILEHSNCIIYLVSRVWYESLAYPLSNAPTLNKIGPELSQEWARKVDVSNDKSFLFYFPIIFSSGS